MNPKKLILISAALIISVPFWSRHADCAEFDYRKLIKDEFRTKTGAAIPVTIEKAIETDGCFTGDGNYFFFASNRDRGNFDVYLRSLTDVTYFKVTGHAAKDNSPAVSPDMKFLVFVSEREDPEGDIFIVKIDPAGMIGKVKKSVTGMPPLDSQAANISLFQDPKTNTIKIIKDASPCWSPDSKQIAFSSTRDGAENIWIMDRDGDNKKQITRNGGMYPAFSDDGKNIIYISYRDNNGRGDIYIIDLPTLQEKRITSTEAIELHPVFMGSNDEIIYTLISKDTNKDGRLDLKDNSVLYYKNLKTGMEYPLTAYSESSFSPRWSPSMNIKDVFDAVIIYSSQEGDNINVNIIPDTGIIPLRIRDGAKKQYELAEIYLDELDDTGRYLMALEKVYHVFGKKADIDSKIYVSRALVLAAITYEQTGEKKESRRIQSILSSISKDENEYSSISSRYLAEILRGGDGAPIIKQAVSVLRSDENAAVYVPYLLEELGDEYVREKKTGEAIRTYEEIISNFPEYKRDMKVHFKLSALNDIILREKLSASQLKILESNYLNERNGIITRLINLFDDEKNIRKRLSIAEGMSGIYDDKKFLSPLFNYVIGKTYRDMGRTADAKKYLSETVKSLKKYDLLYYKAYTVLGQIAEAEKNYDEMGRNYALAEDSYQIKWKQSNYREIVGKMIDYYEEFGERADFSGDYKRAVKIYENYIYVLKHLHLLKIFRELSNEYAPRAHVLYINAFSNLSGNSTEGLLEMEKDYLNGRRIDDNNILTDINVARMDLNKAQIYGLGYLYSKIALSYEKEDTGIVPDVTKLISSGMENSLGYFKKSVEQIEWALFMDDTFIDPEILRGWIYQYIDLKRKDDLEKTGGKNEEIFGRYFPKYLWEKNIAIYEKALETNNENTNPGTEGNLHLNLGNAHFLLNNYPRAFRHYQLAERYKSSFSTRLEEAQFYYHLGYCYWQNNNPAMAKNTMMRSLFIYQSMASGNTRKYRRQIFSLYKFFALFDRMEKNYGEAIGWYGRVIDFASANRIKIDKARFLQEIAECYRELGQTDNSLIYLKKADKLLKKYEITEKKYSVRAGAFGLASFPVYDLGIDAAVIGDNKIHGELDTVQKKLLNLSLVEDIYNGRGNLEKAADSLKKKLDVLDDPSDDFGKSVRLNALNNLGYCYFRIGKFNEAEEFFKKAWGYAADPDVNDLEGMFIAIMNTTHLYAFMLENGIGGLKNPLGEIETLFKRIDEYINSYENKRTEEEYAKLEKAAKARSRKVTDEEKKAVREKVVEEARDKYFTLDIAVGILKYQKAEYMRLTGGRGKSSGADIIKNSYAHYKFNKGLFDLYSDARTRFENGLAKAGAYHTKALQIKLLINIAECQKKTGQIPEAYATYSSAERLARQYEYSDLVWKTCFHTAHFLMEHGKTVEGDEYIEIADDYFRNAIKIIEEYPYLYSGDIYRIKDLFSEYTELLIKTGRHEKALFNSERAYEITRLITLASSSAEFCDDKDSVLYNDFTGRMNDINKIRDEISLLREAGEGDESENLKDLRHKLDATKSALAELLKTAGEVRPIPASFISLSPGIPKIDNSIIYKFYRNGEDLYAWEVSSGKVNNIKIIPSGKDGNIAAKAAAQIINSEKNKKLNFKFIILNDISLEILKNIGEGIPGAMFIPSIERAKYYMSPGSAALKNVFYTGTGLKKKLSKENGMEVDEGPAQNIDLTKYSVIVDDRNELTPKKLFLTKLEPSLFIKKVSGKDSDYLAFQIEAALYSGIKTILLYDNDASAEDLSVLLKGALQKTAAGAASDAPQFRNAVPAGFIGFDSTERKNILPGLKKSELKQFQSSLQERLPGEALMHLNKWYNITGDDPAGDEINYYLHMAVIELIKGNSSSALGFAEQAGRLSENSRPGLNAAAGSLAVYVALYAGNITNAKKLMNEAKGSFTDTPDYSVFKAIIKLADENAPVPPDEFKKLFSKPSALPENRLKLLYAGYLGIFKFDKMAGGIISDWKGDYPLADIDALLAFLIKQSNEKIRFSSARADSIASLINSIEDPEQLKNRALLLLDENGKYDSLTPFAAMFAVKKLVEAKNPDTAFALINEIDLEDLVTESRWSDAVMLFTLCEKLFRSTEQFEEALGCIKNILALLKDRGLPPIISDLSYREAVTLARLGRYRESYDSASAGANLAGKDEDLTIRYHLLLMEDELFLNKIDGASGREEKIKSSGKPEYQYLLHLLKARIEMMKIINSKTASASGWEQIENYIMKALEYLDSSPGVLSRNNRIDIIRESMNILISYKMSRKDLSGALLLNEIKKQLELRSKFPDLAAKGAVADDIIQKFKKTRDEKTFADLLREHPLLMVNSLAGMIPVNLYQKKIRSDSVTIYLGAYGNDILGWIISNKDIKGIMIKDGFLKAGELVKQYRDHSALMKNTVQISKNLYDIFKVLEEYYKDKKSITFITDRELESIPFEIIGEKNMLEETHAIVYAPSIMSAFPKFNDGNKSVNVISSRVKTILNELELVSIKESSIKYDITNKITSGNGHLQGKILIDSSDEKMYIEGSQFNEAIKGAEILYLPEFGGSENIGNNEFSGYNSIYGVKYLIINNAEIQDVNNAIFINIFYNGINEGKSPETAFRQAKETVKGNKKYSYPSYWAGTRLYLNYLTDNEAGY